MNLNKPSKGMTPQELLESMQKDYWWTVSRKSEILDGKHGEVCLTWEWKVTDQEELGCFKLKGKATILSSGPDVFFELERNCFMENEEVVRIEQSASELREDIVFKIQQYMERKHGK